MQDALTSRIRTVNADRLPTLIIKPFHGDLSQWTVPAVAGARIDEGGSMSITAGNGDNRGRSTKLNYGADM